MRETGLRCCCWVARRALAARDSHDEVPPGYFVSVMVTFASLPCHEAHFAVMKQILRLFYSDISMLCASFCQIEGLVLQKLKDHIKQPQT